MYINDYAFVSILTLRSCVAIAHEQLKKFTLQNYELILRVFQYPPHFKKLMYI